MKIRLRTQQVYIDRPVPGSEDWLRVIIQRVEMDESNKVLNIVDRWGQLNFRLADVATKVCSYEDPLNPAGGRISIAGIGSAVTAAVTGLILEKYGGWVDENGHIVVSE